MISATTKDIRVRVEIEYKPELSKPRKNHHAFVYLVTIENESSYAIQLLRRYWCVRDLGTEVAEREIEGRGVVGVQPIIEPRHSYRYASGVTSPSLSRMSGYYTVERLVDGKIFKIAIPEFQLYPPSMLN